MRRVYRASASELFRSFDFRGRTPPMQYFCFLTVAILLFALSIFAVDALLPPDQFWTAVSALTLIFYIPVTSAGVRRLHDTGESGAHMLDPVKPAAMVATCALLIPAFFSVAPLTTGISLWFLFLTGFAKLIFVVSVVMAVIMTLVYFSSTLGMLLVPSEPGSNRYGPNPYEVLQ